MAKPIAHIGYHKTATTWFQNSVYPKVISHRLIDRHVIRRVFVNRDAFQFDAAEARALLRVDTESLPPLLAEEELCGILHIGMPSTYIAKEIARRLQATLPEAQIVIFIRSQDRAAASWYMQYLKEGGTASARRYLFPDHFVFPGHYMHKQSRFDFSQLDYKRLIVTYDELFGRENVHVFPYEEVARDSTRLLRQMQERLGFVLSSGSFPTTAVNSSFRGGLIPIARLLNLFSARGPANKRTILHVPGGTRAAKVIIKQLNRWPVFGPKPHSASLIGSEAQAWIRKHFAESNRWLAERSGYDLEALGYDVTPSLEAVRQPARSPLLQWMRK